MNIYKDVNGDNPAKNEVCMYCSQTGANYLTDCGHSFHLNCFTLQYFGSGTCKCEKNLELEMFKKFDPTKCCDCQSKFNLCACITCYKVVCVMCFYKKQQSECCLYSAFNNGLVFMCIGCENQRFSIDFVPISCVGHGLVCKMCWNYGISNGKCVLGCELKFLGGIFSECYTCRSMSLINFNDFICPDGCIVCIQCSLHWELKSTQRTCCFCGKNLAAKTNAWTN